jgi:hypothetical protein
MSGENERSVAATDGGGTGSQKRSGSSRCSSMSLRPIASGKSGRASGASAVHVSAGRAAGCGRTTGQNSPLSGSYMRCTIVSVSDGRPSADSDSDCSTLVITSQHTGPPAAAIRRRS